MSLRQRNTVNATNATSRTAQMTALGRCHARRSSIACCSGGELWALPDRRHASPIGEQVVPASLRRGLTTLVTLAPRARASTSSRATLATTNQRELLRSKVRRPAFLNRLQENTEESRRARVKRP